MIRKRVRSSALVAAALCGAGLSASVATAAQAPAGAPATGAPATATVPLRGSLRLVIQHVHGSTPFAMLGERIVVRGIVIPYVAGQKVVLSIDRKGRRVLTRRVGVSDLGNGAGQFHFAYASPHTGVVRVSAKHAATPQLGAFAARQVSVRYEPSTFGIGARGAAVGVLQGELAMLRYAVPTSGYFDEATARAVLAFRKIAGLERVEGGVNARIFQLLQRGAGRFPVRYPGDGNHIEADLSKQVLVETERDGRVRSIYTMSSGKPSTPTVIGRFRVYTKEAGTNSHGMVDSSYFIGGYAIHGYAEVPTYAASHGCLRIPIPDAPAVFGWMQIGYPVDVYNEDGGGSRKVRNNAGP
jgi:peptidoglycan hydrolase-like protein with peptidoglycan-binding domain